MELNNLFPLNEMEEWNWSAAELDAVNDGKMEEREARNIVTAMALLNFVSSIPVFQYSSIPTFHPHSFFDYDLHLRTRI